MKEATVKPREDSPSLPGVRERVLETARRLVAERGYAGASTREIAQEVGVTVPALYYHFGSKRGILMALVEDHLERRLAVVEQALAAPGDEKDRLEAGVRALTAYMSKESGTPAALMHDPNLFNDQELWGLVRDNERLAEQRFAESIERGVRSGEFRAVQPLITARLLLGACRAVHMSAYFDRCGGVPTKPDCGQVSARLVREMLSLLLHGLVKSEAAEGQ